MTFKNLNRPLHNNAVRTIWIIMIVITTMILINNFLNIFMNVLQPITPNIGTKIITMICQSLLMLVNLATLGAFDGDTIDNHFEHSIKINGLLTLFWSAPFAVQIILK